MTVPVTPVPSHGLRRDDRPGRRLAIASLLMGPALIVVYLAAYFIGVGIGHALGLAEDELLWEAGAPGVLAGLALAAFMLVPQIVGIVLGLRARRLGELRLGTVGVVGNAAIAGYLLLTFAVGLLFG